MTSRSNAQYAPCHPTPPSPPFCRCLDTGVESLLDRSDNFLSGWIRRRLAEARRGFIARPGARLRAERDHQSSRARVTRSSPNYGALPSGKKDLHPGKGTTHRSVKDPSINRLPRAYVFQHSRLGGAELFHVKLMGHNFLVFGIFCGLVPLRGKKNFGHTFW